MTYGPGSPLCESDSFIIICTTPDPSYEIRSSTISQIYVIGNIFNLFSMTDQDQALLLQNFKAGCKAAFERVFKIYYKSLHMQAFLLLRDEEEAEDQVQQLFLDLWNKQMYRNVQLSIKAYLHASLRNRCFNHLNKTQIKNRLQDEYAACEHYEQTCENGFESSQEQPVQSSVLTVLDELPLQRHKAFSLVHLQDKKYQEAAKEMGISVNSLKTHIKLAVRFLRMRLG